MHKDHLWLLRLEAIAMGQEDAARIKHPAVKKAQQRDPRVIRVTLDELLEEAGAPTVAGGLESHVGPVDGEEEEYDPVVDNAQREAEKIVHENDCPLGLIDVAMALARAGALEDVGVEAAASTIEKMPTSGELGSPDIVSRAASELHEAKSSPKECTNWADAPAIPRASEAFNAIRSDNDCVSFERFYAAMERSLGARAPSRQLLAVACAKAKPYGGDFSIDKRVFEEILHKLYDEPHSSLAPSEAASLLAKKAGLCNSPERNHSATDSAEGSAEPEVPNGGGNDNDDEDEPSRDAKSAGVKENDSLPPSSEQDDLRRLAQMEPHHMSACWARDCLGIKLPGARDGGIHNVGRNFISYVMCTKAGGTLSRRQPANFRVHCGKGFPVLMSCDRKACEFRRAGVSMPRLQVDLEGANGLAKGCSIFLQSRDQVVPWALVANAALHLADAGEERLVGVCAGDLPKHPQLSLELD